MKVASVVGNRPQFIKSGPLSEALRDAGHDEVVVHTGQHYDRELSEIFFEELGLAPPVHRLGIGGLPREEMLARMQPALEAVIRGEEPDWVVVFGDTNSTLAAARAGHTLDVPVAHVEAGLRSGDWSMPEEHNRVETDRLAALLLCPDERSAQTLADEGVDGRIEVVGDVMLDATLRLAPIARERSRALERFAVQPGRYVLATIHREANVEPSRLQTIVEALGRLAEPVVFPAHPRTRSRLDEVPTNVALAEPLGYLDLTALASQARVIVTDSGGLQKEAYWHGVPCVTVRPSTEWVDTIELGANALVGPAGIVDAVRTARLPDGLPPLYGDGDASARIATALSMLAPMKETT
ncbi:MAG TPA: UDP-N-acetylglucosamine 2-epimerase (non-hydrolyzing) [Gaiellaceae bacterium]|nr:UDP-N-acetylglucosamine 2-epimerase (non-hydrolyzing) [Gaiellaceae bacterium]